MTRRPSSFLDEVSHTTDIAANTAAIAVNTADIATNVTAIGLNTTHAGSSGVDHANVVVNDAHVAGDGSDHADVATNTTAVAAMKAGADLTIAVGVLAITGRYHRVNGQAAADDQIDTITGGVRGELLILENDVNTEEITFAHSVVANGIRCPGGEDLVMTGDTKVLLAFGGASGINEGWEVIGVSGTIPMKRASIPVSLVSRVPVAGTWVLTTGATGLQALTRTAAAAAEVVYFDVPLGRDAQFVPQRIRSNYSVNTADLDDVLFELVKITQGADGAAPTAAILFGTDGVNDYDDAHNSAVERGDDTTNPELHFITVYDDAGGEVPVEMDEILLVKLTVDGDVGPAGVFILNNLKVDGYYL